MSIPVTTRELSEKHFLQQVRDAAKLFGWRVYHPWLSIRSEHGFPDLTLVRERVIFAELKTDKGRVSDKQQSWIDALNAAGAEVYVWRPGDWDSIVETLKTKGRQTE